MAKEGGIVTHLTAMQEIASMDVLCSDKTGTLTTARITVFFDEIWCAPGVARDDVLEWAALASNPPDFVAGIALEQGRPKDAVTMFEQVAAMALFLASDDAALITAHDYFVDAGWR